MNSDIVIIVVFSIFGGLIFIYLILICSRCLSKTIKERAQSSIRRTWRANYTSNLRGNLVRTYKRPIEQDFYIDKEHELGKGGCGVVVVGENKDTHSQYAIKMVNKATAERGRLDRELKLLKDVDHTNIVRLFSVYDTPTYVYFVMELCLGGHLGNLLARQPNKCVDENWGRILCRQLLSAVAHIHSRGIAHRDIKLQNILIDNNHDRSAQLKLIDFGYGSRYIGALPMKTKCGTPYTTAPEVIRESYDERCDVWSVGVVLYIMLSGRRPFEALDINGPLAEAGKAAMITNILAGRYHFNHKTWHNVSKSGINFVKTLMNPDYKSRIRSKDALENPWLNSEVVLNNNEVILKSAKSFRAISSMKRSLEFTDFQRTGMLALVFGIPSRASADLRQVFQSFDIDASGSLSLDEFGRALNALSPELTKDDIKRLFHLIDLDKNNQISFTEFLAATLDPRDVDIEELSKAFRLLDEDGNGFITKQELSKVVKSLIVQESHQAKKKSEKSNSGDKDSSKRLSMDATSLEEEIEKRVDDIFNQVDVNNDGCISQGEFLCAMTGMDYYLEDSVAQFLPRVQNSEVSDYDKENVVEDIDDDPFNDGYNYTAMRFDSIKKTDSLIKEISYNKLKTNLNVGEALEPMPESPSAKKNNLPAFTGILAHNFSEFVYDKQNDPPSRRGSHNLTNNGMVPDTQGRNLAFYEVNENLSKDYDEEIAETSSSSYGTKKIATLFGTPQDPTNKTKNISLNKNSTTVYNDDLDKLEQGHLIRDIDQAFDSGSISSSLKRVNKGSKFQDSPKRVFSAVSSPSDPQKHTASACNSENSSLNKFSSVENQTDKRHLDKAMTDADSGSAKFDLRGMFTRNGRARSYRSTSIIENSEQNETIKIFVEEENQAENQTNEAKNINSTQVASQPGATDRNINESYSMKNNRPVMTSQNSGDVVSSPEHIEPAAPPLSRLGSRAFSFNSLKLKSNKDLLSHEKNDSSSNGAGVINFEIPMNSGDVSVNTMSEKKKNSIGSFQRGVSFNRLK